LKTVRNAFWLSACRLSGDALNLLLFVFISREFGPSGVGAYSYGFALATFVFAITGLGIYDYGIRQYALMDAKRQPSFLAEILGTQLVTALLSLGALGVYLLVTGPTYAKLIVILELTFYQLVASLTLSLFIPDFAHERMARPAVAELVARVVACVFAIVAVYAFHASLPLALIGFPLGALAWLGFAGYAAHSRAPVRLTVTPAAMARILKAIGSFALIDVFAQLFTRVGVIVLSLAIDDRAAGQFAAGMRLVETAIMPLGYFALAVYPRLSVEFMNDPAAFKRGAADLLWVMSGAGLLVCWGTYFVAPDLLVPLLGEKFAGTAPLMRGLAAVALILAIEAGLGRVLLAAHLQAQRARFIAVGAIVSLVVNIALVPTLSGSGAVAAAFVAYLAISVLSLNALRGPLSGALLRPLLGTVALAVSLGAAVVIALARMGFPVLLQGIAALLVLALVGGAAYPRRFGAALVGVAMDSRRH
jgi:O-antigen/teichoic acid export membrane protein